MNARFPLAILFAAALAAAAAPAQIITIPGGAYGNGTDPFTGGVGQVYHVTGPIDVTPGSGLTIPAGSIVKFTAGNPGIRANDFNALIVNGSAADPVVMTSIHDTSAAAGGDTAQTGVAPAAGDWGGITYTAGIFIGMTATRLRYCGGAGVGAAIEIVPPGGPLQEGGPLPERGGSLVDIDVEDSDSKAVDLNGVVGLLIIDLDAKNTKGALNNVPLGGVGALSNIVASGTPATEMDLIVVEGDPFTQAFIKKSKTVNQDGRVLLAETITIDVGESLFAEGVVLYQVNGDAIIIDGVFDMGEDDDGDPVTIRSGSMPPVQGDVGGLILRQGGMLNMDGAKIRDFGANGEPAVKVEGGMLMAENVVIENGGGPGIEVPSTAAADADIEVRDSLFQNVERPILIAGLRYARKIFDNTSVGNVDDRIEVTDGNGTTGTTTIGSGQSSMGGFLFSDSLELRTGDELIWSPGTNDVFEGDLLIDGGSFETNFKEGTWESESSMTFVNAPGTLQEGVGTASGIKILNTPGSTFAGITIRGVPAGSAALQVDSPNVIVRGMRVEDCGGDGFVFNTGGGTHANLIAHNVAGRGILMAGGSSDIVHATVTGCGTGIERTLSTGRVRNSISSSNATNFAGLGAADVLDSCGGFAGQNGNIDVDPLFVDPLTGDLRLQAISPCVDAADLGTALAAVADARNFPRATDHDLDGQNDADMGALELSPYVMTISGALRIGTVMDLTTEGPAGNAFYLFGLDQGSQDLGPFGAILVDDDDVLHWATTPTGPQNVTCIALPDLLALVGFEFAVQVFAFDTTVGRGILTNAMAGSVFE